MGGKRRGGGRGRLETPGLQCRMEWHSGGVVAADLGITKGQLNGDGRSAHVKWPKMKGGGDQMENSCLRSDFRGGNYCEGNQKLSTFPTN